MSPQLMKFRTLLAEAARITDPTEWLNNADQHSTMVTLAKAIDDLIFPRKMAGRDSGDADSGSETTLTDMMVAMVNGQWDGTGVKALP